MSERTDVTRYTRELFDLTWRHGQAEMVADELDTFAKATSDGSADARPLFHPLVPRASKHAAIKALAARAGLSKPTTVLLEALVQNHSMHVLPRLAAGFRERLNHKTGVIRASVTTAAPLPPDRADALATTLGTLTGRQVTLSTRVDPSIIGGVVTQIDSTVYDGSVTRQLARMRQKLVEKV
jgi:F-type H+-transporting ATPase subunit delta